MKLILFTYIILLEVDVLNTPHIINKNEEKLLMQHTSSMRRVCYYTNWAQYRSGPAKFFPENVDPNICTHIIYAFAKLNGNKLAAFEWNDESTPWQKGMYERFHAIKSQNPSVKLLLAVGGWNLASAPFTRMVASDASRKEFASTTVQFLRKNGFEGLDIDWEYPANRGSPPEDKRRYTQLVQELRHAFDTEAIPAGKERLLLSAALPAGKDKIDSGFEVPQVSQMLDLMNLMTYDLHGSWEDHTGHHAQLYSRPTDTGNDTILNVAWAANYWVSKGAPKDKMNIGMPLYGRSFKLPWGHSSDGMGAPASGAGEAGLYTREAGFMAYYEVCEKLKSGATKHYDPEGKVPYFVKSDLWVGYDDKDSLKEKVDFVKQGQFGGIMVWSLDLDDFSGSCGEGKYPLMKAIINELNANTPVPANTQAPITSAPVTNAPVTNPPMTNPPITNAPIVTNPPVTNPPTQATTTQAPATQAPVTQAPVTQAPVTQAPVTQAPAATQAPHGHTHQLTMVANTEFDCTTRNDGYYASPYSCENYYVCAALITFRTDCHPGLQFNEDTLYCDFPDHVKCRANTQPANTAAPVVNTQAPVVTNAPITQAPVVVTQAPVVVTQAPVVNTQPPWYNPTTTQAAGAVDPKDFCKGKMDGFYRDPTDCARFYQCSFGLSYHESCPSGTYFKESIKGCDWASSVSCP